MSWGGVVGRVDRNSIILPTYETHPWVNASIPRHNARSDPCIVIGKASQAKDQSSLSSVRSGSETTLEDCPESLCVEIAFATQVRHRI